LKSIMNMNMKWKTFWIQGSLIINSNILFISMSMMWVCIQEPFKNLSHAIATPLWPSVRMKLTLPKVGDLESSGTPECLEFNSKGKNTSPWGVLSVIGKVLKCKCPKWPRIGHLDICSPSYGQKKGRESNWQFHSRPLKVRNRLAPNVRWGSATRSWKALEEGYKFGWDLVPIGGRGKKLRCPKVPGVQNRDSFGTPLWESRDKQPLGCGCDGVTQRIR
jgi:hypothetical protein